MSKRNRRLARKCLILSGILLVVAWLAPSFFSAERYRHRLEAGLEQILKRPVTFGAASFRLIPHPGFSIWNVVILEDPAFGSEPFARVERIDCDLRWRSFWRSRFSFSRLYLENPTLNAVRNTEGQWNLESLLTKSGFTSLKGAPGGARPADPVDLEAEGARVNFKVGEDKKPFAVTDLTARLTIDPPHGLIRYDLTGKPVRTNLSLPTPGETNLTGVWTPGPDLRGPLKATLRSRGSMLYDWIPLVSGRNPGVYGVVDATLLISGSLKQIKFQADGSVSQFYRWDLEPPSNSLPLDFNMRGSFDREAGRALIEKSDFAFASSHLLFSGTISRLPALTDLDLVISLQQMRLEDVLGLSRRFARDLEQIKASGRLEGGLSIRGFAGSRDYEGLVTGYDLQFRLPRGTVRVAEASLPIDNRGARLSPVRIALAPHLELVAQGEIEPSPPTTGSRSPNRRPHGSRPPRLGAGSARAIQSTVLPPVAAASAVPGPRYNLTLSASALPLADLLKFAYENGVARLRGIEAEQGICGGSLHLAGSAWPPTRPRLGGKLDLFNSRFLLPGLSQPLTVAHAAVTLDGQRILTGPVSAAIGQSSFSGRFEHDGDRSQPWDFTIGTGQLTLDQAAAWFEVLGYRAPPSLFERLPGLSSFATRRAAASTLFAALNARGQFTAAELVYQSLALKDFVARVDISDRVVKVTGATFRAAGGRGWGSLVTDLSARPPRLTGSVSLEEASLRSLTRNLQGPLRDARGTLALTAGFSSTGLSRPEIAANLAAQGKVTFKSVSAGDFDFLGALVRESKAGTLEPARHGGTIRQAAATMEVRNRSVTADFAPLEVSGARLNLRSTYGFDGRLNVDVRADLSHLARRWQSAVSLPGEDPSIEENMASRHLEVHLTGDMGRLRPVSLAEVAHSPPGK